MVKGCEGFISRAHLNTLRTSGRLVVCLGSLYRSHVRIEWIISESSYNIFDIFFKSWISCCSQIPLYDPGLGDHAHAYHPSNGSGCLPRFGSIFVPNTQSSNNAGITFILCLAQIERNLRNTSLKYADHLPRQ